MELPISIKNRIEELANQHCIGDLKKSSKNTTDKYLKNTGSENHLVFSPIDVLSYAVVRMPATYSSIFNALKQTLMFYKEPIESVLDVGAGVGTASIACLEMMPGIKKITAIEREKEMINLGKDICYFPIDWKKEDYTNISSFEKADLVVASYTLNEVISEKRLDIVKRLFDSANKLLIIVEPGTPLAFSQIKQYRELFLSLGGYIVAPCPNCERCLIDDNDWCHFTSRVQRSKLHKLLKEVDVPFEDEKYSYIAVSKTPIQKEDIHRIMRHPLIKGNTIELTTCSKNGVQNIKISKANKEAFKQAKKCSCGDFTIL